VAIGRLRVPWSSQPSVILGASYVEDSLPTPKIHQHIAIEVVGRLHLAQESRSLSDDELSLVDFLLEQITLPKEVVAHHDGEVSPHHHGAPG
jgi:hypothetical protein